MSSKIILKKSGVLGKIPQPTDLAFGEVAINYADGKLYFKNTSSNVQSISAGALGVDSASTIALINEYVDSAWITDRVGPIPAQGVDSASTIALINEYVDSAWITDRVGPIPTQGVDSSSTIALINEYVDSAWITDRVGPIPTQGVDSASTIALIDTYVNATYINALDVNAGKLDGQDGIYFLNYNNLINTPTILTTADVENIVSYTPAPPAGVDSDVTEGFVRDLVDSAFVSTLVNNNYIATLVDSAYVALRVGVLLDSAAVVDIVDSAYVSARATGSFGYSKIAVTGALTVEANQPADTLTLAAGANVTITTDINTDKITISAAPTAQGLDFGTFTQPAGFGLDLGTF
jgi:hypothetical protein